MRFNDNGSPSRDEPCWGIIEELAALDLFSSKLLKHIIVWSRTVDCLALGIEHGLSAMSEIQGIRDDLHILLIRLFEWRMRSEDGCDLPANNQKWKKENRQSRF